MTISLEGALLVGLAILAMAGILVIEVLGFVLGVALHSTAEAFLGVLRLLLRRFL